MATTRKPKTPEQIARRHAAAQARREAKKKAIPVTDATRKLLQAGFKQLMERFEAGTLTYNQADNLISLTTRKAPSKAELEAKLAKERAKLARLEAALAAATGKGSKK